MPPFGVKYLYPEKSPAELAMEDETRQLAQTCSELVSNILPEGEDLFGFVSNTAIYQTEEQEQEPESEIETIFPIIGVRQITGFEPVTAAWLDGGVLKTQLMIRERASREIAPVTSQYSQMHVDIKPTGNPNSPFVFERCRPITGSTSIGDEDKGYQTVPEYGEAPPFTPAQELEYMRALADTLGKVLLAEQNPPIVIDRFARI